jgi:drug/metabolite transporter (DMT)-like permease
MHYLGETASLLTSACYSLSAVAFTRSGRRVGSAAVNVVRLGVALVVMVLVHLVLAGSVFPFAAGPVRCAWLGVSGLIGFALGDALLFESYVLLGPRLTLLIYTLWPVLAALMAWLFLGESMGLGKGCAMLVTLAGIALVVVEQARAGAGAPARPRRWSLGLALGVGAAAGQAVGFIFAKVGMAGGFSPVSANVIRVGAGALALWAWQAFRGELRPNLLRLRDTRAAGLIALGSLLGPVTGVVLSLYAINHARYLGVASTLMSLSPVLILPISVYVEHERVSARALAGTLVCILGTCGLFLS